MAALCCHCDVQTYGSHAMLAGDPGARRAVALDNLFAVFAIAAHGVSVSFASRYFIDAEFDHLYFRMKGFRVGDCLFYVGCF